MKKNKEYIIAGSLLSLAIVGMVFAYRAESGTEKAKEEDKNQVAFQEVEDYEEEAKEQVEDVSNILAAKQKEEQQAQEAVAEQEQEAVQETASEPQTLHFAGELEWPANGNVIMNYSMDKTVYFKSLEQYRYNPAVIISANVNDAVTSAAAGKILEVSKNEVTGCTVSVDLGDGYRAIYGQLKEVPKKAGDSLKAGEVVGYISEPTKYYCEEGSNLYFQLLKDGSPVDPMAYFQ